MRKLNLIFIPALLVNAMVKAQGSQDKFSFDAGLEYRLTPFNFKSTRTYSQSVDYNRDKQLSGVSLFLSLDYKVYNRLEVGISQSLRYDEKYVSPETQKLKKGMIYDTHLKIKYSLLEKSQIDLSVFAGYSFMNYNTGYSGCQSV
jgi:hypothetical protein